MTSDNQGETDWTFIASVADTNCKNPSSKTLIFTLIYTKHQFNIDYFTFFLPNLLQHWNAKEQSAVQLYFIDLLFINQEMKTSRILNLKPLTDCIF